MANKKSTSPWVWVGCGCLGLGLLVVGGCLAVGYWGAASIESWEEDMRDPVVRDAKIREVLGAETLPAGMNGQFYFRVPLFFEMVMLSDGEVMEFEDGELGGGGNRQIRAEDLGDNALLYLAIRDVGDVRQEFEGLLEGEGGSENLDVNLDFRSEEVIGRGQFTVFPQEIRWVAHRGEFRDGRERVAGSYTVMLIDCPDPDRVRAVFLWGRQDLEAPDEAKLSAVMEHFQLCAE